MTDQPPQPDRPHDPSVGHETTDVSFRGVLAFFVGLALALIAVSGFLWWMMHGLAAREAARKPSDYPLWKRDELPADPRLEGIDLLHPDHDVGRIHDRGTAQQQVNDQEAKLRSYGWIDRKAGTVRIPIEEAMKKVAGNLPSRPGSTTEEFYQAPSASSSGRMPRGELP